MHHLVGGYVRYISPHIIIIITYLEKIGFTVLLPRHDCVDVNR